LKKQILTVLVAGTFGLSGAAFAAPAAFAKADANGDGFVDEAEFANSGVKKKFETLDKDGDGKLNKKEYSAGLEEDCA
jgi:hypothetical protein